MKAHILGYPRIGAQRELKFASEQFWKGDLTLAELQQVAKQLRGQHWLAQKSAGLDYVSVGDFSLYDQVLDHAVLLGAIPARFGFDTTQIEAEQYFALARGNAAQPALEMTKWFDTNYHYLVPELSPEQQFSAHPEQILVHLDEALLWGCKAKPVLLGPLSFLYLSKLDTQVDDPSASKLALLDRLLPVYVEILHAIETKGVSWVQIDEPILALDLPTEWRDALPKVLANLSSTPLKILLATYFENIEQHLPALASSPVAGVHIDAVRAPEQVATFVRDLPAHQVLSLGVVNGRNIWANDLSESVAVIQAARTQRGENLWVGSSCSLLHSPFDLTSETALAPELKGVLAFARQKLDEIVTLKKAVTLADDSTQQVIAQNAANWQTYRAWSEVNRADVRAAVAQIQPDDALRNTPFAQRIQAQNERFQLPLLPTTTIGSFPQTGEIRRIRAAFKKGAVNQHQYEVAMRAEITRVIHEQERLGLDVLVHGEAERNDMVEYYGEQLDGYAFTQNGWVQSYGSRCVKPPIIYGDVARPQAMTVAWSSFAQSLTQRPVKGMLTGPVTMLQWSFVREDLPRHEVMLQIALALRSEVLDLEAAGIGIIQIDEPALREGLPLKRSDWQRYLDNAVFAFGIAGNAVRDHTQIHTHMCYSEFGDILPEIAKMDADVISIETSRSRMELLDDFGTFAYPNQIGPGVYDIHSPRTPSTDEMVELLHKATQVIPVQQLWVNPDCGLKTRSWSETLPALSNLMAATQTLRAQYASAATRSAQ